MLLILQLSNMEPLHSLKLPPTTDGNKGQTTSSRINVTVSEVFVLKGLVNVYIYRIYIHDTLEFFLKLQSHIHGYGSINGSGTFRGDPHVLNGHFRKTSVPHVWNGVN